MSHLPFAWYGNKRTEYKEFKGAIPLENKLNIIEPFCGSASISFALWLEYGDKFNYYLNDLDDNLIDYFNLLKSVSIDEIFKKMNEIKLRSNTKETFKILIDEYKIDKDIYKFMCISKISLFGNFTCFRYKAYGNKTSGFRKTINHIKFQEFINSPNVFITKDDWYDCYNRHKDDSQSLIIFDPPYLDSYNDCYKQNPNLINIYDKLDEIRNDKATSLFIIEKIDKIEKLFKDWIISIEYDKRYPIQKKKTIHIMYSNH